MKILALETSTQACSVALLNGTEQDFSCMERFEVAPRRHTHLILPMIDSVLAEAGYDITQMDALAFGRGPGAFTGVRVATGVVQAIAYGADLAVAQISSLAALAQGFLRNQNTEGGQNVLVANDARMHEVYFGAFELQESFMTLVGTEQVLKPEQLGSYLLQSEISQVAGKNCYALGNGWSEYAQQLQPVLSQHQLVKPQETIDMPHARDIAYLAFREAANKKLVSAEQVSPVYLRDDVAKKAQKVLPAG